MLIRGDDMDAFFASLSEISSLLLPTLGAVSLVFLIVVLKKVYDLLKEVIVIVSHMDQTLKVVDETLTEIQAPVKTVANVARGIDTVTNLTQHSLVSVSKLFIDNFDLIQSWFKSLFKPKEHKESVFEPDEGESI